MGVKLIRNIVGQLKNIIQVDDTYFDESTDYLLTLKSSFIASFFALDGWLLMSETLTYASASTVIISGDVSAKYSIGMKIKFTQSSIIKYFEIIDLSVAGDTTLTLGSNYGITVANAAITLPYFSTGQTPLNFPPDDIGRIISSGKITTPLKYLYCDGSAISKTTYANLYGAITADKGIVTITEANPGVVTLNSHGFQTGDCIELTTTGVLPTNLVINTNYYIIYVNANTFQLATSYANAFVPTPINTSGAIQSGVHSLRFCPFGISGANNFLLPNFQSVVPKGIGTQTINTRAKTAPAMGQIEEDRIQGFKVNMGQNVSAAAGAGVYSSADPGAANVASTTPITDGVNGTPRTGETSRENSIGVKFYIKYQ